MSYPPIYTQYYKAKAAFAHVLSAALRAVATENSVESWTRLLMLPKCVLQHGGCHNKPVPIDALCGMWSEGQLGELWHKALQCSSTASCLNCAKEDSGGKKVQLCHFIGTEWLK